MSRELWQQARDVFLEALEVEGEDRHRLIESLCGGNAELEAAVAGLLCGHEEEGAVDDLADEGGDLSAFQDQIKAMAPAAIRPGEVVGAFEVIGKLGEGGMASVFRARRVTANFHQEVALKVLSSHQLKEDVLVRFNFERQIAASLDHPNIAKLIDGGLTEDSRPFFALELVEGEQIDVYCDAQKLTLRERIGLVIDVAGAVHHAHRNLLVHRDLKPSNILVDGEGRVRLLDFGIAKPLDPEMAGTARTQTGALLLTPRYSSPEQFVGAAITTASDQYQLGLLLFELVTGHCHHLLEGEDLSSMGRRITELDSPRPSKLLSSTSMTSSFSPKRSIEDIARLRRVTPDQLDRQVRGDLDTILLRTLEKDPERRYSSVEALAEDLQRYLDDEPVLARPQSFGYRLTKFARRHRWGVAAAGLGLAALILGGIMASWQAIRATRAEAEALQEAATATQVSDFLVELFEDADPGSTDGAKLTAQEVLERGRDRLATGLEDQPMVRGRLMRTISQVYYHLGDYDSSLALGSEALEVHRKAADSRSLEVAADLYRLAETHKRLTNLDLALELYRESLDLRSSILGRRSLLASDSLAGVGWILSRQGKSEEALPHVREVLDIRRQTLDRLSAPIARAHRSLGYVLSRLGDYEKARDSLLEAAAIDRELSGPNSRIYAVDLAELAVAYWHLGSFEDSVAISLEGLEISEALYGTNHHLSLKGMGTLALSLIDLARYDEAEGWLRKSLAGKRKVFGERSADVGGDLHNLGYLLQEMGRFEEAEGVYSEALSIRLESLGTEHPRVAELRENLAEIWVELGRFAEAEASFRQALADKEAILEADNPRLSWPHWGLGLTYWHQGRLEEAETALQIAKTIVENKLGKDHRDLAFSLHILANVKRDGGALEEAEGLYRKALEIRAQMSPERLLYRRTVEDFSELLRRTGREAEAARWLGGLPKPAVTPPEN